MKTSRLPICVFAVLLAISCRASTNSIDQAILAFPKISAWEFRPEEAVRSANALIAAGREAACTTLKRVGNAKWDFPKGSRGGPKGLATYAAWSSCRGPEGNFFELRAWVRPICCHFIR